jgi:hypothetical protein
MIALPFAPSAERRLLQRNPQTFLISNHHHPLVNPKCWPYDVETLLTIQTIAMTVMAVALVVLCRSKR